MPVPGVTRNRNAGRNVEYLEYEAYRPMADEQIITVIDEMRSRWEIGRVAIAHRTGRVDIGETSMVVESVVTIKISDFSRF